MFKKIKFKNRKLIGVLSIVLAVLLIIGIASTIILIKPKDSKEISSSKFVIGKITTKGEFLRSDDYLCTNDLIPCDGLVIKPVYNAKSKFQVFFYDINYKYVYSTEILGGKYEFIDSIPFVEYCRVMILPDREGEVAEDFKVNTLNKSSYVNEFKITVDKKQTFGSYKDYFEEDLSLQNYSLRANWDKSCVDYVSNNGLGVSKAIDISDVEFFYFVTDKVVTTDDSYWLCLFTAKSGYLKSSYVKSKEYTKINNKYVYKIDCSGLYYVYFNYYLDSECHLYFDKG